jgi:hypothetical protein
MRHPTHTRSNAHDRSDPLVQGLAWFSIGLGALELFAPRTLTRVLGLHGQETLVRTYGLREIAAGVAILGARDASPGLWSRVVGDAIDLGTLATAYADDNARKQNVALAAANVAGVTALDVYAARKARRAQRDRRRRRPMRDYSRRSGFPRPAHEMRGAAADFVVPDDMRTPEALRPFTSSERAT